MRLDVFLQVLGTLEGLAAKLAFVRFQRDVDSDVRGDVIALDGGGSAAAPLTGQVEVVGRLAADMTFTDVLLTTWLVVLGKSWPWGGGQGQRTYVEGLGGLASLAAALPLALQVLTRGVGQRRRRLGDQRRLALLLWHHILRLLRVGHGGHERAPREGTWQGPRMPRLQRKWIRDITLVDAEMERNENSVDLRRAKAWRVAGGKAG